MSAFKYSYQNLWDYLEKENISKMQFKERVGISSATLAKMNANAKVADSVLEKISIILNLNKNCICEFKSNISIWLDDVKNRITPIKYVVYIDDWPVFYFKLNEFQARKYRELEKDNSFKKILSSCEHVANMENQPNAGILNSTQYQFEESSNVLELKGSFAVIEKIINIFIS